MAILHVHLGQCGAASTLRLAGTATSKAAGRGVRAFDPGDMQMIVAEGGGWNTASGT